MWEYRFETVRVKASYLLDNTLIKDRFRLKNLGHQRWEAVSMTNGDKPGDILILFKRHTQEHLDNQNWFSKMIAWVSDPGWKQIGGEDNS